MVTGRRVFSIVGADCTGTEGGWIAAALRMLSVNFHAVMSTARLNAKTAALQKSLGGNVRPSWSLRFHPVVAESISLWMALVKPLVASAGDISVSRNACRSRA